MWLFTRKKPVAENIAQVVDDKYQKISKQLTYLLSFAPLDEQDRHDHLEKIVYLERDLWWLNLYSNNCPEFFSEKKMSEFEVLLSRAADYLNWAGHPYNRFLIDWDNVAEFKEGVKLYKKAHETFQALLKIA